MKLGLYSIRDELVGYGKPFALPSDEVAIREFRNQVNSETPNLLNTNKSDMVLFKLGSYDDQSGEVFPEHISLLRANEV